MSSCTKAAWRVGAWLIATAIRPRMKPGLKSLANNINAALMQLLPPLQYSSLFVMAPFSIFILTPPLRSCHSSAAEAPRSRDSPGYRLALDHCVGSLLCIHASHSPFCNFRCRSYSVFPTAICSAPSAHSNMPRVHSRMSCRRGSSQGCVTRQPSSTTSDPSSKASDFCFDSYPVTRSGRGRGQGQLNIEARSQHSQSHTARFRFPCTLSNSSFIASVTIGLREDNFGSVVVTPRVSLEPRTEDKHDNSQISNAQRKDPGGSATQDMNIQAGPSIPTGVGSSSKEGHPSKDEDPYQYGCRIVEESPPTSHEA